jgi:hypothetical protein
MINPRFVTQPSNKHLMTHDSPKLGTDGAPLPVVSPERDPRLTIRVIRELLLLMLGTVIYGLSHSTPNHRGLQ